MSRMKQRYRDEVAPALAKEFGYTNVMAIPRLEKVVLNMGLGEATQNAKIVDVGADELGRITGQKAVVRRATKSVAQFKLRQGMPVGAMVTLRGERMYEFLDRLISIAMPRIRDFRGVSPRAFDGRGNYSLGVREQIIFPEIQYDQIDQIRGMDITITTTARDNQQGRALLEAFNFPFRK
jgi:large subunit ribosomal protein L5